MLRVKVLKSQYLKKSTRSVGRQAKEYRRKETREYGKEGKPSRGTKGVRLVVFLKTVKIKKNTKSFLLEEKNLLST
jgi:hypothetical protein